MFKKSNYIIIFSSFFGLGVGYALINRTLSITGNSEVKQNTWDIHFDNVKINESSVTATTPPTANGTNPSIGFSFQLDLHDVFMYSRSQLGVRPVIVISREVIDNDYV